MKVALISPYLSIASHGIRSLSSFLKSKGISVRVFFLCLEINDLPSEILCKKLSSFLQKENVDLIGVSLSTNYFNIAKIITKYIKAGVDTPVLWGGIHPTIMPEECLEFADMVCIGEGEHALWELCRKLSESKEYADVNNLCFKDENGIRKNNLGPLIHDMDKLPFPDYDFSGHYIWDEDDFYAMNEELFKKYQYIPDRYETVTSRGCPYQCSYCCNSALHKLYSSEGFLRKRSPNSIVRELEAIKDKFPFIKSMYFDDEAIFSRSMEEIELFCELYKKRIGLPFRVSGVHPLALTKEKMELFINAGLKGVKMGIQTGSGRISRLYKRENITKDRILEATRIIHSFKDKLDPPGYDFILDNPYENRDDLIETLNLLLKIPKPYELSLFSLTFFPGTEITNSARKDGLFNKDHGGSYSKDHGKPSIEYFNILFKFFSSYNCPHWIQRILIDKNLIKLELHLAFFFIIVSIILINKFAIIFKKLVGDLLRLDFSRIKRKFRKINRKFAG